MCRAEVRVEGPLGIWTARFASPVFDEPAGLLWDSEALLVVKYGFLAYALASRTGELRWAYVAGTPTVAVLGSTRLPHVLVQSEVETVALDPAGAVRWRVAHGDVVAVRRAAGEHAGPDELRGQRLAPRPAQRPEPAPVSEPAPAR